MYKGIFWLTRDLLGDKKLLTVKVSCDSQGQPLEPVCFSSKSGDNFNHRLEWSKLFPRLTQGKPFNIKTLDLYRRAVENCFLRTCHREHTSDITRGCSHIQTTPGNSYLMSLICNGFLINTTYPQWLYVQNPSLLQWMRGFL